MKTFLKLLLVAAVLQFSLALFVHKENGSTRDSKFYMKREPPIDKGVVVSADEETVDVRYIEQRLNNFDPQDERTWQMRYLENNFFLQAGGPIFIYIGGEWTVSSRSLLTGHMHDMARDLNGTMFYTEHRYYGASHPTPDTSTEHMRYLNIDQALADLAHFIVHVKQTVPGLEDSGVILVGASYSATMATWFAQKYPHLVNGAWASSAPLEAKVDFVEYKEVVSGAMQLLGGANCYGRVERAFSELERLVAAGESSTIEEVFQFCYPFDLSNELDIWLFFSEVAEGFSYVVQYHSEHDQDIQTECGIINSHNGSDIEALADWWWQSAMDPGSNNQYCYDHRYMTFVRRYNVTDWSDYAARSAMRQWTYQTCAEYGWFQSSGSDTIHFGSSFPVDLSLQLCLDLYNERFWPEKVYRHVDRTNVIYGSLLPDVRNVYSTHGELDPWRTMGTQVDINESSPTFILPLESHCSDLGSISDRDTPEMRESKERIFALVQQWLGLSFSPETTTEGTTEAESTAA